MNVNLKKTLVTGATGFTGSNLVKKLVQDDWNTSVIVRAKSSLSLLSDIKEYIKCYEHDGSSENMLDIISEAKPHIVFHLASYVYEGHEMADVTPLINSNILFGTQLLEAMRACNVKYMVNTGTFWQHYENQQYSPVDLYAATKQAFEDIIQYYVEAHEFNVITLELYDTYGPNDPRGKLISLIIEKMNTKEQLDMSPGEQLINLVHINDVVRAYEVAAIRLLSNEVLAHETYVVDSGEPVQLKKLIKKIEQLSGPTLKIKWAGRPYRFREIMSPYKGQRLPGWEPQLDLDKGLEKLVKQIILC